MSTMTSLAVEVEARTSGFEKGMAVVVQNLDYAEKGFVAAINKSAAFADSLETLSQVGTKAIGVIGGVAQSLSGLPVGGTISSGIQQFASMAASVAKTGIMVGLLTTAIVLFQQRTLLASIGASALTLNLSGMVAKLGLLKIAWQETFATQTLARFLPMLGLIATKLLVISGIAGGFIFAGMVASVESANREFAAMIGKTTPLQDALKTLGDAWSIWTNLVVGDFANTFGTILGKAAGILVAIAKTVRYVNDLSGGWAVTTVSLIGWAMALFAAYKSILWVTTGIRAAWAFIASSAIFRPIIGMVSALWAGLNSVLMTQIGLNAATAFYVSLTVAGLALVAVGLAASAAYTASAASEYTNGATAAASFAAANGALSDSLKQVADAADKAAGNIKSLAEYRNSIKDGALTVEERDAKSQQQIANASNPVAAKNAALDALWNEADHLGSQIESTIARVEELKAMGAGDDGRDAEIEILLAQIKMLKDRTAENVKRQDEVRSASIAALTNTEIAFANQKRIDDNLKQLDIKPIETANDQYTAKMANLQKALDHHWVSENQYTMQLDSARKSLMQSFGISPIQTAQEQYVEKLATSAKGLAAGIINQEQYHRQLDAAAKNLKQVYGFTDILPPMQKFSTRLDELATVAGTLHLSTANLQLQMDKLAGEIASAAGIGDLFADLPQSKVANLAKAFDGIEALLSAGQIVENQAVEMREKAARKFLSNNSETKTPTIVLQGTTEAYQRDQEVKRGADLAQKQYNELQKISLEAETARKKQEDSADYQKQIAECVSVLKTFKGGAL